jgi:hypothetical protein
MSLDFLRFLTSPAFVLAWYGFGVLAAAWVLYDSFAVNRHVSPMLKAAWPIIMVFFSVLGLVLYLASCRPPRIGEKQGEEAKQAHSAFVSDRWKKVVGSVIHCVAGDGLGIISAMVVTRWLGFSFWPEFWIEYAVGFAFGWIIFQYGAMRAMGHAPLEALWKGGRAEFFSMITVMIGMGLVMRFVTPNVVGYRPMPDTAAFWGFAALGLLAGGVLTYPVNWWLVSIGWKHGMG